MPDLQDMWSSLPIGAFGDFAWRVVDAILVGAVVAWLLSLGRLRDVRAARAQIAEQLCRVFGMRLYRSRATGKLTLEELSGASLQGWASLERLQWNLDLHRAQISLRELRLVQGVIEDLLRIRANQLTMEFHLLDEYLPGAARRFLPKRLREPFIAHVRTFALQNLIDSAAVAAST